MYRIYSKYNTIPFRNWTLDKNLRKRTKCQKALECVPVVRLLALCIPTGHLSFILTVFLFVFLFQVNGKWGLPDFVCDFYIAMDVMCSTSSIFNLVAISIDR
jgi:7 transmembrane receptor (rhodopsin family).